MNREQLSLVRKALLNVKTAEMRACVSEPLVEHTFSEGFEERMKNLIEDTRSERMRSFKMNKKILAILIAAAVLISLILTVTIAGEKINDFFATITEKATLFFAPQNDENPRTVETEYYPVYIPDGFEITCEFDSKTYNKYILQKNLMEITFTQMVANNSSHGMNTEDTEYSIIEVGGNRVYYTFIPGFNAYDFYWNEYGYAFSLLCTEGVEFDEAIRVIESVIKK